MKQTKKEKLKQKRISEKRKKEELKNKYDNQIVNIISQKQIQTLKGFNAKTFMADGVNREDMIQILNVLLTIAINSNYIDEIAKMTRQNISENWFDKAVNKDFVKSLLEREMESAKECPIENLALKICFWANRIAHHLEDEVTQKEPKHRTNEMYIKYFLNPKYHYNIDKTKEDGIDEVEDRLYEVLGKEDYILSDIDTPEKLNNLFLGLSIRNELWTLKQQMIKIIILNVAKNEKTSVKVTSITEDKKDLSISGSETLRLIIREVNGIAPIVMHCDKEIIEDFLSQNNLKSIEQETSNKVIDFAKKGKVGIHFVLNEEDRDILEYEADESDKAKVLNDILYRGENEDGR